MIQHLRSTLLLLLAFTTFNLYGQVEDTEGYRNRFWLKWGLNSGVSWQTSDVKTRLGPGWGSTLEVPLLQSARGNVVLGLRGRYLWTRTYGRDYERSYTADINSAVNGEYNPQLDYTPLGYYFANHRTSAHELDGELNLTFQPAYRQSGWFFNVFGGLGGNKYKVDIDQLDIFGSTYPYAQVPEGIKRDAVDELRFQRDHRFESDGFNSQNRRWVLTPAAGVGVGYRVSPWFSFGWEYKLSFPLTDDYDGQRFEDKMAWGLKKDVYHYTSFGLNFQFGDGDGRVREHVTYNNYDTRTPPTVSVLYPGPNQLNISGNCVSDFRFKITHIARSGDIRVTINGRSIPPSNFNYDVSSGFLSFTGYLNRGRNEVRVEVSNSDGRAYETVVLNCSESIIVQPVQEVMTVCVPTGGNYRETRVINVQDWPSYQQIGAVPGPCPPPQREMTICMYDPYSPSGTQTLIIPESEWPYYQSQGASMGACIERTITICTTDPANPTRRITMQISESAWPYFQSQGASRGACPQACTCLTICMIDMNAPGGARTLTIRQDEWPAYQQMGAVLGECNEREMLICYKEPCSNQPGSTLLIKESAWPYYQQRGATMGPCPDPVLTVCLPDPNAAGGSRTLTIRENEWPRYQAMGASWGPCSSRFITICLPTANGDRVTMTISETAWSYYASRGAVRGICPPTTMTICVPDPSATNGSRTMTISQNEWPYWQGQGATQGACSNSTQVLCIPSSSIGGQPYQMTVSSTMVPYYQSQGATVGPCPAQQITICLPDPTAPGGSRTLLIAQNQWPQYQAQGAVQGPCGNNMMTICYPSSGDLPTTMQITSSMWPWYQSHGATQGPCPPQMITLCLPDPNAVSGSRQISVPADQLSFYQNQGAVQGPCDASLVQICYKDPANVSIRTELNVPANLLNWYLSHGGSRGKCPEEQIKICLPDPLSASGGRSLTIKRSEWPRYEAMGAIQGSCAGQMVICYPAPSPSPNQTMTIFANLWPWYQTQGAIQGKCPELDVVLCMPDASAPNGSRQISVKSSEVDRYIAMGAQRGPCRNDSMTICIPAGSSSRAQREMVISTSVWPYYQSQGATEGPCPEKRIKICIPDPNSASGGRTMTIPESMWATYQAQGAVQGDCGSDFIQICLPKKGKGGGSTHTSNANQHDPNSSSNQGGSSSVTMTIPSTLWPSYQAMGATRGKCPEEVAPVVDSVMICMPDPTAASGGRAMVIPRSQLAGYISRGAVEGRCEAPIAICIPAGGRGRNNQTIMIPANLLTYYQNQGATTGPCPELQVTLCMPDPTAEGGSREIQVAASEVAGYQAQGAVEGPCSATSTQVCWPDPTAPNGHRTIQVPDGLLNWYLNNGATTGACPEATVVVCIPDPNYPGGSREMTIPQSGLAGWLAQGAVEGRCDANQTQLCYNDATVSVSNTVVSWYMAHGALSGACPEPQITICVPNPQSPTGSDQLVIAQSLWPTYQAQGAVQGQCAQATTTVCYEGATVTVANNVLLWFTNNGATNGACVEPTITICMPDPNGTGGTQILTIPQSQWANYQAQGAVQGPCENGDNTICYQGQNLGVYTPVLNWYLTHGATNGPCPEATIEICLPSPQTPGGSQQMTIPQSQWATYQAQGAVQGPCSGTTSTVCYQSQTIQVPSNLSGWYIAQGATSGPCAASQMTICLPDSNAANGSREILIQASQWPSYQAQGATQGSCSGTTHTICLNGQNMQVSNTVVAWYLAHGAIDGVCPNQSGTWDRSSVSVTGSCENGDAVFTVLNTGSSSNGNMQGPVAYRFFENNVLVYTGSLQLQGGQSTTLRRASNGVSIRCEVDQRPGHPGNSNPRATEVCTPGGRTNVGTDKKITICHIPPRNPRSPQTMQINENEWNTYSASSTKGECDLRMVAVCLDGKDDQIPAASLNYFLGQGATQGACPKITICTVPPANPNTPQTMEIVESAWAQYAANSAKGACNMQSKTICYNNQTMNVPTSSYDLYYAKKGAQNGACPRAKITICTVPPGNPSVPQTLSINEDQWTQYAATSHKGECDTKTQQICFKGQNMNVSASSYNLYYSKNGATLGACPKPQITICNVPPTNPSAPQTLTIDEDKWNQYAATAHKGACDTRSIPICYNGQNMNVPTSSWNQFYSKKGATQGACPKAQIAICNVPPTNPSAPQNLTINEDQWNQYAATAHKGGCDMRAIPICYNGQNLNVPTSSWNLFYSKKGATQGACPKATITICNVPPSNPSAPQNLTINEDQWNQYAATAHKGGCDMRTIPICYNGQNLNVPTSSWNLFYSKKGATQGACPKPKITICHVPPADPSKPKTMEILESDWSKYASQAHKGGCNTTAKEICYKGKTMSVPTSSWSVFYSKNGAKEGKCPVVAPVEGEGKGGVKGGGEEKSGGKNLNLGKPGTVTTKPK